MTQPPSPSYPDFLPRREVIVIELYRQKVNNGDVGLVWVANWLCLLGRLFCSREGLEVVRRFLWSPVGFRRLGLS